MSGPELLTAFAGASPDRARAAWASTVVWSLRPGITPKVDAPLSRVLDSIIDNDLESGAADLMDALDLMEWPGSLVLSVSRALVAV